MTNEDKIFEEALDVISDGQEELSETKKVIFDKKTKQVSVKLPKNLALKKSINENTEFEIVVNPKEETLKQAQQSGFILFIKEVKNGKGEKGT